MDAKIREHILHDITHFGLRAVVGTIFIVHGFPKFDPGFLNFLANIGVPAAMQYPVALAEFVGGIVLIVGLLTRIAASILAIDMLGAIFHVKQAASLTGQHGYEFDLILLASSLTIIAIGPGRISLSHILKKIPRFLQ